MPYYNTTHESPEDRQEYEAQCTKQEIAVLATFKSSKLDNMTPSEVWTRVALPDTTPLTSIRRSITNLTDKGMLEKTATKRRGPYGRNEYAWKLAAKNDQQLELFKERR